MVRIFWLCFVCSSVLIVAQFLIAALDRSERILISLVLSQTARFGIHARGEDFEEKCD